jgi:hypothetical protein
MPPKFFGTHLLPFYCRIKKYAAFVLENTMKKLNKIVLGTAVILASFSTPLLAGTKYWQIGEVTEGYYNNRKTFVTATRIDEHSLAEEIVQLPLSKKPTWCITKHGLGARSWPCPVKPTQIFGLDAEINSFLVNGMNFSVEVGVKSYSLTYPLFLYKAADSYNLELEANYDLDICLFGLRSGACPSGLLFFNIPSNFTGTYKFPK